MKNIEKSFFCTVETRGQTSKALKRFLFAFILSNIHWTVDDSL